MIKHMKARRTKMDGMTTSTTKQNQMDDLEDKPNTTKHPMIKSPDTRSSHPESGLLSPHSDVNFECSVEMDLDDKYCNYHTKPRAPTLLGHEFSNFGVPTIDTYYLQDFKLFNQSGIKFWGYHSICFRSGNENDLCRQGCISPQTRC